MSNFDAIISSPIAPIGIKTHQDRLVGLQFLSMDTKLTAPACHLTKLVAEQLDAYFAKKLKLFSVPMQRCGTPFHEKVWETLTTIDFGHTRSYGDLAGELATGARAIGNACRRNPIVLAVPCHRVVAKQGLGGFSGARSGHWPAIKSWLLQHEQSY